jgi:hypothetical protein
MWPRAERALAAARAEADRSDDPYAPAIVLGLGGVACCAAMRFEEAIARLTEAAAVFRATCPGSAYEIATAQFYLFVSLAYSTRYGQLRPLLEPALVDASERGDRHAGVMLRVGILNTTWVFAGDPARARRELAEARREWPTEGFRAIHYQALVAEAYIDLYEGQYEQGYERLRQKTGDVKRSLLLHLQAYRAEFAAIRGRLALACAVTASGKRREALLREGERTIRELAVMPGPLGRVNVGVMRSQAAALRGNRDEAFAIVERMAEDDAGDAWLARQCARMLLARVRGDPALGRLAEAELTAAGGVADPRMTRLYFAAFDGT